MVIKSPFKDYYDFVAHQYGGGDPRLVYARNRITPAAPGKPWSERLYVEVDGCHLTDLDRYHGMWRPKSEPDLDYLYLVIAGKAYLLARPYSYLDRDDLNTYKIKVVDPNEKVPWHRRINYGIEFGKEYQFLVELCRKVKAPVFAVMKVEYSSRAVPWRSTVAICGRCPILANLGVPSLIDPYQMYQELSMFMGNKMKDTPDTQPPVELANREKIVKAGFDLVQSFRHRK